jgi:hypothetical protein
MKTMKVMILTDETYQYFQHVFASYTRAGIAPEETLIAADLFTRVQKAQSVDFSKLGNADIEKLGPGGVTLNLTPEQKLDPPGDHNGAVSNG